jgi:adenosine deaminase
VSTEPPVERDAFPRMPKVELHVHLDCCLSFEAVSRLAPGTDRAEYRRRYVGPERCASLAEFLRSIEASLELLQTADGLRVAVEDLFDQLARENVLYAEIRFAPLIHLRQGLSAEAVVGTVADAVRAGVSRAGIEARLILCALRHFSAEDSLATARLAARFRGRGVVGLDLAADEAGFPLAPHVAAFALARAEGLWRTAHAGEARGPESVRETLELLHPTRIGHGVRSVEDPELPAELAARGVHLEVCPSCNLQTGMYRTLDEHPVDRLRRAGVSVGINTDARTVTAVTLSDEYRRLHRAFGWGAPELRQANLDAIAAAFVDDATRAALATRLVTACDRLEAGVTGSSR